MKNSIKIAASVFCALIAFGCSNGDKMEYGKSTLVMTGTDKDVLTTFVLDKDDPSTMTYPISVSATSKVKSRTTIHLKIDNSLIESYNAKNRKNYAALDEDCISFPETTVVIEEGRAVSSVVNLTITSTDTMEDTRVYVIPVTIESADGDFEILEGARTIYLRISNTSLFTALDINNSNIASNFIFDDDLKETLYNYTYEVKCYIAGWRADAVGTILRMCAFLEKDESHDDYQQKQVMFRFNENDLPLHTLNTTCAGWAGAKWASHKEFTTKRWYLISVTYDGSTTRLFIDGEKDSERDDSSGAGAPFQFQRIELGMSWGGYTSSQLFNGRIAEMRVWNRALTAGQIKEGLCGVDPETDGLLAYWRFNEGEGHIFHDATGHGYDMDWSNTVRDTSESGTLVSTPNAYRYVESNWVSDDENKCAN